MFTRRQLTKALLMAPLVSRAATPQPPVIVSIDGSPLVSSPPANLDALPAVAGPNTAAYSALNVRNLPAGSAFQDPVTGVRTIKLTSSGIPGNAQFYNMYSTLGLQISQAWGANRDQYTVFFLSTSGAAYLCDYRIGASPTNYRTIPAGEGRFAFSRLTGQEQIAYIYVSGQLRCYDTSINAYVNTGLFPIPWPSQATWLQLNGNETWATMTNSGGVSALNLIDGAIRTMAVSGLDEIYSGYGSVALIKASSSRVLWNLETDSLISYALPSSFGNVWHTPSLRGFWAAFETNTGGGKIPNVRIHDNGSVSSVFNRQGYWGQYHCCGHWWNQAEGPSQYYLQSNWSGSSSWTQTEKYAMTFVRCDNGSTRVLGHSYSDAEQSGARSNGTDNYRAQPHATQSTDGKIVIYTSNMLDGPRLDVFLMEVPMG